MYDHVIWIDKEWWLLAFIIVMMAIYIPVGRGYGPADTLALIPAVALLTIILFYRCRQSFETVWHRIWNARLRCAP